jgi:hypothetical protein
MVEVLSTWHELAEKTALLRVARLRLASGKPALPVPSEGFVEVTSAALLIRFWSL